MAAAVMSVYLRGCEMTREEKEAIKGKAINDAMNSIENRVRHVYNQGFEEGKEYYIQKYGNAYNKGLEDAWECARNIIGWGEPIDVVGCAGLRNFICGYSASEAIARLKKYEEQQKKIEKSCDTCGHGIDDDYCEILTNKKVCEDHSEWIPENTAKSCKTCGYSYGQHKEYCNIFGCFDCEKWTKAQICCTCRYDGDNYEKFNMDPYEKKLHCAWCDNYNEYKSIYNDDIDDNDDEIRVGDQLEEIIESSAESRKCMVLKIDDCVTVVYDDGEVGYINPKCYRKTGKHFPELIEFLEKMKGE